MISIIIPAHNEQMVIQRTLHSLVDGAGPAELEIIVVCNGCTDRTAEIARAFGGPVRVLETEIPSKSNALNLGDQAARSFPRFYIDADIILSSPAVRAMAEELNSGRALAVAPRFEMELTGCSWFVRAFYEINDRMPSSRDGIGGSGVYGLSPQGRARFSEFPSITADDGFIRCLFKPEERRTLLNHASVVFAPKRLSGLVKIKTRSHFGGFQLRQRFPELWQNRGASNGTSLKRLAKKPLCWPKLAVYGYVKIVARARAHRQLRSGRVNIWERDNSARHIEGTRAVNRT